MRDTIVLADLAYGIHLIFHKGNERTEHYSSALHNQSRKLVTKALASARRHQHECIIAREEIGDDSLLLPFERVESKIPFQIVRELVFLHSGSRHKW